MKKIPYTKPALSYEAQIDQLKMRGLVIESDSKALHLLENISYYRLSGYWYPMLSIPKSAHLFKTASTFDNVFKLYCFDRELRKLVIGELEKIEIAIRGKMIYNLSHKYGATWYTDVLLFKDANRHGKTLLKIQTEYNRSDEKFLTEFKKNIQIIYPQVG